MQLLTMLLDNAATFAGTAAVLAVVGYGVYEFWKQPSAKRIAAVKEWLLYAVTEAEKAMGGGTGKLKLRQVYDLFLQRFPAVSQAVQFETFSAWVDEALEQMKSLLASNKALQDYVKEGASHD